MLLSHRERNLLKDLRGCEWIYINNRHLKLGVSFKIKEEEMNNFNCIDDSSYDIITETNTGGYIHMNNKDLYLLLDVPFNVKCVYE